MVRQITVGGGSVRTALAVVAVVAGDVIVVVVVDVTLLSSTRLPRIIGAYILRISFCAFLYFNRSNLGFCEQWPQRRSRRCHTDLNQRRPAVFAKFALKKERKNLRRCLTGS